MGKNKFEKFIKGHKLDWNKDCATLRDILFTAPAKNVIHGFAMKDPRFVENVKILAENPSLLKPKIKQQLQQLEQLFEKEPRWLQKINVATIPTFVSSSLRKVRMGLPALCANLKVISWNIQSTSNYGHKKDISAKIATLAKVIAKEEISLAVLSECPTGQDDTIKAEVKKAMNSESWETLLLETGFSGPKREKECAAFVYDSDVLSIVDGWPKLFPCGESSAFYGRRSVATAFFAPSSNLDGCEGLGLVSVSSIHLKSYDNTDKGCLIRRQLEALAKEVVPWIMERMSKAEDEDKDAFRACSLGRTILMCGDFNSSPFAINGKTCAGCSWEPLEELGFEILLRDKTTNFGPPIGQKDYLYDNALVLCQDSQALNGTLNPLVRQRTAYVHPVMVAELQDMTGIEKLLSVPGDRLPEWVKSVEALKGELCNLVKLHWGDHKPIVIELSSKEDMEVDGHDRLKSRLQGLNLVVKEVKGDGNCQFRALSDQMYETEVRYPFLSSPFLSMTD